MAAEMARDNGCGDPNCVVCKRDYSGVSTEQLAKVYFRYTTFTDIGLFAEKIKMDEGHLKKILIKQDQAWTGLGIADVILLGLDLKISDLIRAGEIEIVPGDEKWYGAEKMVSDMQRTALEASDLDRPTIDKAKLTVVRKKALTAEDENLLHCLDLCEEAGVQFHWEDWPNFGVATQEEIDARIASLKALRESLCTPNQHQRDLLDRNAARIKARSARAKS